MGVGMANKDMDMGVGMTQPLLQNQDYQYCQGFQPKHQFEKVGQSTTPASPSVPAPAPDYEASSKAPPPAYE